HLIQSYPLRCPRCGQLMLKNGFKIVNVLGPSLHYQPTIWSISNQKYLCKPSSACPSTITELAKVKDIKYRHHISQAIKQQVMIQLTTNESQIDIAKELGISDWTVRRVIFNLDQFFKPNYHWLPRHIAFDDFKSGRFAPSGMSMILMNIENHRTIDIILSRRNRYLRNYFLRYDRAARLAVRTVTVDLYTPYRHLIHELFPHAIIIADHFHVVAQAYRALNKIRVKAMNQAGNGSHQWRALKHFWKLILTPAGLLKYDNYWSRRNFGYTQLTDVEVIQRLLAFNDDLKQAYRYYQDLILAINHRSKDELNHLLAIKWTQLPQSLQKVQRTLRRHLKEIITSFKYGDYTNGPVEGTNNKIKAIKRTAYGFRNFFNFRARILLALPNSYFAINWKNKRTAHVQSQTRAV
ncbi:ISL3 family transposase, partial [Lactobacillus kefiranofaciens]|uniref:ISL3 family transposase n=1 Tax=Lactobacillus kefiranofaciens TaxID=267818 RepID=UPI0024699517